MKAYQDGRTVIGHDHFWQRVSSRRQFLGTTAGVAAALAASPLWMPTLAEASSVEPVPIPGGFAPGLHAFLGPGVEPSTIFNFRGVTGVAAVRGTGTAWNTKTGAKTALLFDSDNRFMQGTYVGADGERHRGTFAFVWLDLYVGQIDPLAPTTHQQHDFNPGMAPSGLLWTVRLPDDRVEADADDLDDGASMRVKDLSVGDYGTLANSLFTHTYPPEAAVVSLALRWTGNAGATSATDAGTNRFNFKGIFTHATLSWSAIVPSINFAFRSDPARTSHETLAELVNEQNGVFFGTKEDQD